MIKLSVQFWATITMNAFHQNNKSEKREKNACDSYANYTTIFIAVGCRNFRIPVFRSVGPYLSGQVMIEYLVLIFILNYRSLFCQHGQKVPPALILRFWSLTDWHVIQFFAQLPIFHTIWKSHFSRQNSTKIGRKYQNWKTQIRLF